MNAKTAVQLTALAGHLKQAATQQPQPAGEPTVTGPATMRSRYSWVDSQSPYNFAPPTVQVNLLLDRLPPQAAEGTITPQVPDDLIRAAWTPRIRVDRAAALASLAKDNTTLEWILSRDRRKTVISAVHRNPNLDPKNLWHPDYRARAALTGQNSVPIDGPLSRRIKDIPVSDFAEILLTYTGCAHTRTAIASDPRLDGPAIANLFDKVYTELKARNHHLGLRCSPIASELLDRVVRSDNPVALPMRTILQMWDSDRVSGTVRTSIAACLTPDAALEFIERSGVATLDPDELPGHTMAARTGMPLEWYRIAARSNQPSTGDRLATNPDVPFDILLSASPSSMVAFTRVANELFGEDLNRWELAYDFRENRTAATLRELVNYVEAVFA